MKAMICISCPKGCHLMAEEEAPYLVTGNQCPRGQEYGRNEIINPLRVVTSTVWVDSKEEHCCPVKTDRPIPKSAIFPAVKGLKDVTLTPPVNRGQVVVENIYGTGANFIATKDV